jgi:hypothetical protein
MLEEVEMFSWLHLSSPHEVEIVQKEASGDGEAKPEKAVSLRSGMSDYLAVACHLRTAYQVSLVIIAQ